MKKPSKLILLLIMVLAIVTIIFCKCNGITWYRFESRQSRQPRQSRHPRTLIIASTHGNEPAGYYALKKYIETNPKLKNGTLTLIPAANSCGFMANERNNPLGDYDINRSYPKKTVLNSQLKKFIDDADWVIDLHEGWGYYKLHNGSVGSGLYPGNTREAVVLTTTLINGVNRNIIEDYKKFSTENIPNVNGSLRDYCSLMKKNYILVETSGINDIQPVDLRIKQQLYFIENIVNYLHNK